MVVRKAVRKEQKPAGTKAEQKAELKGKMMAGGRGLSTAGCWA